MMYVYMSYVYLNVADPFLSSCIQNKRSSGGLTSSCIFSADANVLSWRETSINNDNRFLFVLPVKTWPAECDNIYTSHTV